MVALGKEPTHCLQQEVELVLQGVVRGSCRKQKRDRQPEEEVLAAEEGTLAVVAEAAHMDCFVDSTQLVLPCQDRLEQVVPAEVHQ